MMKKNDLEYNLGEEFATLPDEYLQGTGNQPVSVKKRKAPWKRMLYMVAAFSMITYEAIAPYAFAGTKAEESSAVLVQAEAETLEKQTDVQSENDSPDNPEVIEDMTETEIPEDENPTQTPPEPIEEAQKQQPEEQAEESPQQIPEGEQCANCGGTGKCDECLGDGYLGAGYLVSCPRCHGSFTETCAYCDASGNSTRHEGKCDFPNCMGAHVYACTICGGGTIPVTCQSCAGSGNCKVCGGSGA